MTFKLFFCTYPIAFIRDKLFLCFAFVINFNTMLFHNSLVVMSHGLEKASAEVCPFTFSNKLFCFVCVLSKYKQIFFPFSF